MKHKSYAMTIHGVDISRHLLLSDEKLAAVALAGDISAEIWLKAYLLDQEPVANLGRMLLQPSSSAPKGFKSRGKIVCTCLNVADTEINTALENAAGADQTTEEILARLQSRLKCGTNCGSCVPEIKK